MQARTKNKIVFDTKLWIGFLLTRNYSKIDRLFRDNSITILFSQELIDEFLEVVQRPKFRRYFSLDDIEELLKKVRTKAVFVTVTAKIEHCRDPQGQLPVITCTRRESYTFTYWRQRSFSS